MACAGSAGGSRPPHQNPFSMHGQCEEDYLIDDMEAEENETSPQKKKQGQRGPAKGNKIHVARRKIGGGKLPLMWDPRYGTKVALGEYASMYRSEVGKLTKRRCPPEFRFFKDVDGRDKQMIIHEIEENFDNVRREVVLSDAQTAFAKWKSNLKQRVDDYVATHHVFPPPRALTVPTQDRWDKYIRRINTPEFKRISQQNANNRSKLPYPSRQGRMPMGGHRYKGLDPKKNPEGHDPIIVWGDKHRDADGTIIHESAKERFEKMSEMKQRVAPNSSRATPEQEKEIFREVLGVRRDRLTGLGPSLSSSSSFAPEQSQCSSASMQSRDPQYGNLQTKYKQLKCVFSQVMNSLNAAQIPNLHLPVISLSDEDEDEDEDENEFGADLGGDQS